MAMELPNIANRPVVAPLATTTVEYESIILVALSSNPRRVIFRSVEMRNGWPHCDTSLALAHWISPSQYAGSLVLGVPPLSSTACSKQRTYTPALRYRPQLRLLELIRGQFRRGRVHALRLPPIHLGPHGVEVHEPTLEDRLHHRLQRLIHPPVEFDLVVQRPEDCGQWLPVPVSMWERGIGSFARSRRLHVSLERILCCCPCANAVLNETRNAGNGNPQVAGILFRTGITHDGTATFQP